MLQRSHASLILLMLAVIVAAGGIVILVRHQKIITPTNQTNGNTTNQTATNAPQINSQDDLLISLERTQCYGTCPAYTVTIDSNGLVTYMGKTDVKVSGQQTGHIAMEKVQMLVDAFYDADYFAMADRYYEPVTDLPTTTTSISINGKKKMIVNYSGAPAKLRQLEKLVDETAQDNIWIGGNASTDQN